MTEKYIDLAEEIDAATDSGHLYATLEVLQWLDKHPDQVPRRTITESCYRELMDSSSVNYQVGVSDGFFLAGGRIVPDPEPTNADKLEDALPRLPWLDDATRRHIAEQLDKRGVKAGGDDDH